MSYLVYKKVAIQLFEYANLLTNKLYSKEFPSIDFELIAYLVHGNDKYLFNLGNYSKGFYRKKDGCCT